MKNAYRSNHLLLSAAFWLLTTTAVLAQGVRGRITDSGTKSPIPGATIVVVNSNVGTTTGANGEYTLRLSPGTYTLQVSFVGYENQSIPVTVANTEVVANTSLTETSASLSEVVVTGSRGADGLKPKALCRWMSLISSS